MRKQDGSVSNCAKGTNFAQLCPQRALRHIEVRGEFAGRCEGREERRLVQQEIRFWRLPEYRVCAKRLDSLSLVGAGGFMWKTSQIEWES